jgi:uncharacterized membrane protein (DUF2068 family)
MGRRKKSVIRGGGGARGLRMIALLEAAKGVVVVIAGLGVAALIHHDVQRIAEEVVTHLHINPARHLPRVFLDAAAAATDPRLWAMAIGAAVYSTIRFIEAYGLWNKRTWAEWFGILSGALYLPVELFELYVRASTVKACVLAVNVLVVAWLVGIRWRQR